jgi:hypothetical protein
MRRDCGAAGAARGTTTPRSSRRRPRATATGLWCRTWRPGTTYARIALALPEAAKRSSRDGVLQWLVKDKVFAWERPLRRADLEALCDAAPEGPILAARVPDLGIKEALLAEDADVYFTTPHFDGYPAILVRLLVDRITMPQLEELLAEAWFDRAPKRLAREYLDAPR